MKYPIKSSILAIFCCVSSLAPAAEIRSSRNTNPALLYWQAASELPALSDEQAKQLREIARGKADFNKKILEELDFKQTVKFLRKAVASEAPCDWGLAWEESLEMRTPHLAKMREISAMTLVLAEAQFANGETTAGVEFLLMSHHIARDIGATPTIIGNLIQNYMERNVIATAARHCLEWDVSLREGYARRLAALPELSPLHVAFMAELNWIDWFKNQLEENFEEASKKFGLDGKNSDQFKSPDTMEEMFEIYRKVHARGMVALKLEGEARNLAVAEIGKEIVANKDNPKNLFVSLMMPSINGMVRSEDQTAMAQAMLKAALEHGPEISKPDLDGHSFELIRKDGGLELSSKEPEFSLKLGK